MPRAVWAVLAAGLAFRAFKVWINPGLLTPVEGDFHLIARSLAEHGVYAYDGLTPTAFRLPFWPLTLALLIRLTGSAGPTPVIVMNILLSMGAAVLTYLAARRLTPERWAAAAALMAVLNPFSAHLDFTTGYESVLSFLFAALMLLLVRAVQEGGDSARPWLAAGAVTGLSLTCRSSLLLLPPLLTPFLPSWTGRPGAWRWGLMMTAAAYLFVAPWLVRNFLLFGRVIPFEDGMGLHAFYQSTEGVQGITPDEALPEPIRGYYFAHDPQIGPASKEVALANIRRAPLRYVGFCVGRLKTIWFDGGWAEQGLGLDRAFADYRREGAWGAAVGKVLAKGAEAAFLLAALAGMVLSWKTPAARPVTALILYMNIHLLTQGLSRYVVPAVPALAVLAALGAQGAWARLAPRRAA
ncbi:hypothetical protein EPO15_10185 [bacterium]|nr:MAG: hypothetical protein EPO15_10185 [bacterium]